MDARKTLPVVLSKIPIIDLSGFVIIFVVIALNSWNKAVTLKQTLKFFQNTYNLQCFPIFIAYFTSLLLIPLWRKLLPQMDLKKVMVVYNIGCVLLSIVATGFLLYGAVIGEGVYSLKENWFVERGLFVYTISKVVELLDTVFMLLRHRWRQISFLHVFHHSTILLLGNYAWVYVPFPPVAVVLSLNSIVHIVLYAYYGYTACGYPPNVVWKKRLTQFQIAQFIFDLVFSFKGYLYHGFCIYSIFYGFSMLGLFSNFYYHAYIRKRSPQSEGKEKKSD